MLIVKVMSKVKNIKKHIRLLLSQTPRRICSELSHWFKDTIKWVEAQMLVEFLIEVFFFKMSNAHTKHAPVINVGRDKDNQA